MIPQANLESGKYYWVRLKREKDETLAYVYGMPPSLQFTVLSGACPFTHFFHDYDWIAEFDIKRAREIGLSPSA